MFQMHCVERTSQHVVDGGDKLKELNLGVATSMIESISVNESWFANI
jgi:hypothetical protein